MKNNKNKTYIDSTHTWGRIFSVSAVCVLLMVPVAICIKYDAWPSFNQVFKGLLKVIPIFWTTQILEILVYSPMLGTGATYLSFVTGNVTNLKLPCVLNARETAKTKPNTEEDEIVSTIATATSAIVTTVILAVGVIALSPILPKITAEDSFFAPAFKQVLPALFGALGAGYLIKHWRLSFVPVITAVVILIFDGNMGTGTLIPICVVVSIIGAYIMYISGFLTGGVKPKNPLKK
ncbi:MAG: hypothetical protein K5756_03550 [Clostridiales bacterium]|nr:hypothetical protein [Clostridiales bacterium]